MCSGNNCIGTIHSIETLGGHDGPGLRTVVFMQGCSFRCVYCHNPDTWNLNGGESVTVFELLSRILRYKPYFIRNGGVTLSGGEPLLQTEFALQLFTDLKAQGIHTVLDTAGSVLNDKTEALLKVTDEVLLDIKHTDKEIFQKITKAKPEAFNLLFEFLHLCKKSNVDIVLRQVIVPGLTDNDENIKKLSQIAREFEAKKTELLPYHTAGVPKWNSLNLDYTLKDVLPPTRIEMEHLNLLLKNG
ncbi:MAG: pyruvate formate-lyase-activating protein [Bacillota bacterium]|nr:pyruvate formate-lyase-activating protein [Bacillota bacterium]